MPGTLAPSPKFVGADDAGNPIAGGKVYTYYAGTTTPAPTYSDADLDVSHVNTNPVILDSAGRATIYLQIGISYKFILKTAADVTVWTQDNIAAIPTSALTAGAYTIVTNVEVGTRNDWAPGLSGNTIIDWSGLADLTVTGIAGGTHGQILIIKNRAGNAGANLYLSFNSSASAAGNKLINFAASGLTPIGFFGEATFYYDAVRAQWVMVAHEHGIWTPIPYNAANFQGGGMVWTVDPADVIVFKYRLSGRTLSVVIGLDTTSVAGTPGVVLTIFGLPFTAQATAVTFANIIDNNIRTAGVLQVPVGGSSIQIFRLDRGNFALAANTTFIYGTVTYEIA